jgi:maltose alpha-D-glucosyltransferase/alpha-amylase
MDPVYGYPAVNVEAQTRSSASLLNWTRRLVTARKAQKAFSRGTLRFLRPGNRKILAYLREHDGDALLCVANLARSSQPVELDLREFKGRIPLELLGNTPFPPIGELPYLLTLPPWGFYWFSLATDADSPKWHVERPVPFEFPVLVIPEGLMAALSAHDAAASDSHALLARRVRDQLERDVLPQILPQQRWFDAKGRAIERVTLKEQDDWQTPSGNWLLAMVQVDVAGGSRHTYSQPLALAWEQGDGDRLQSLLHCTLARVRQRARVGILYDAFCDDAFDLEIARAMKANAVRALPGGELRYKATSRLAQHELPAGTIVRHPPFEQSNTLVVIGENELVLKGYRRLRRGVNPEIEMGRFLTEVSRFPNVAALCGSLEHVSSAGDATAVAVLHEFVHNEGSGWDYTLAHLRRLVDDTLARQTPEAADATTPGGPTPASAAAPLHGGFHALMETLGRRTAQLHGALARRTGDPAFDPEPFTEEDSAQLRAKLRSEAQATLDVLSSRLATLPDAVRAQAQKLLASSQALFDFAADVVPQAIAAAKTRYHGDYHLGQVLISEHDFIIVDFEGEPSRPLEERRAKHSPLRDVAGMLRSFGYAAAVAGQPASVRDEKDRARVVEPLALWRRETSAAFLRGYRTAINGAASFPADDTTLARLIEAFTLEKALYELRYELASRPDWVAIPLSAILEQLAGSS